MARGVKLHLHQAAQDIADDKASDHQSGGHGDIAHGPAVMLHHIGLENGPHIQNAHTEHDEQSANQSSIPFCVYTHFNISSYQ